MSTRGEGLLAVLGRLVERRITVLLALPNALIDQFAQNFCRRFDLGHRADRFAGKEGHRCDRSRRGLVDTIGCETQRRHPCAVERGYLADGVTLEGFGRCDARTQDAMGRIREAARECRGVDGVFGL